MDNTTIHEFLQEKNVLLTGPYHYSDSLEMANSFHVLHTNSKIITELKNLYTSLGGEENITDLKDQIKILNMIIKLLNGEDNATTFPQIIQNFSMVLSKLIEKDDNRIGLVTLITNGICNSVNIGIPILIENN